MSEYIYDVALSFADEQRDYVEKVAEHLHTLGVTFFYDNYQKTNLWGKNLIKYLEKVYYQDSRYCVVFISHEYRDKCWTKFESESIEERVLLQNNNDSFQQCILPVRFDDTKIPGIRDSLGVIYARKTSPKELAQMIYEKIQNRELSSTETVNSVCLDSIFDELVKILPENFIEKYLKKSIANEQVDAILFFNSDNDLINNFLCYDGKLFINQDGKLYFLNLGYFNETEMLFEITPSRLMNLIRKKVL